MPLPECPSKQEVFKSAKPLLNCKVVQFRFCYHTKKMVAAQVQ